MADRKKKSDDFSLVPPSIYGEQGDDLPIQVKMSTDREVPGDITQLSGFVDEVETKLTFHVNEGEVPVHKNEVCSWTWPAIGVKQESPFDNIHHGTAATVGRTAENWAHSSTPDCVPKSPNITDKQDEDVKADSLDVEDLCSSGREEKRDPCRKRGLSNRTDGPLELETKKFKHCSQTTDSLDICEIETEEPCSRAELLMTSTAIKDDNQNDGDAVSISLYDKQAKTQLQDAMDGSKPMGQGSEDQEDNSRCDFNVMQTSSIHSSLQKEIGMDTAEVVETDIQVAFHEKDKLDIKVNGKMADKISQPFIQEGKVSDPCDEKLPKVTCTEESGSSTALDKSGICSPCDAKVPCCSYNGISERNAFEKLNSGNDMRMGASADICNTDYTTAMVPIQTGREGSSSVENDDPSVEEDDLFLSCDEDSETGNARNDPQCLLSSDKDVLRKTEEETDVVTNISNFDNTEINLSGLANKAETVAVSGPFAEVVGRPQINEPSLNLSPSSIHTSSHASYQKGMSPVCSSPAREDSKVAVTEPNVAGTEGLKTVGEESIENSPLACKTDSEQELNKAIGTGSMESREDSCILKDFPQEIEMERSMTVNESHFFKMLAGHGDRNNDRFQKDEKAGALAVLYDKANIPDEYLLTTDNQGNLIDHKKVVGITNSAEKVSHIIDLLLSMVIEEIIVKDSEDMETDCGNASPGVTSNKTKDSHVRATVYPTEVCVKSPRLHVQILEQIDELPEIEEKSTCKSCVHHMRKGRWECVCGTDDDIDSIYDGEIATPLEMLPTPDCSQSKSTAYSDVDQLLCCMESLPLDEPEDEDPVPLLTVGWQSISPLEEFSYSAEHTYADKHSRRQMGPSDKLRLYTGAKMKPWDSLSQETSEKCSLTEASSVLDKQSCGMNMDYELTVQDGREPDHQSINTKSQKNWEVTDSAGGQGRLSGSEQERRMSTSYSSSGSSIDEVDGAVFRSVSSYSLLHCRGHKEPFEVNSMQAAGDVSNNINVLNVRRSASVFSDNDKIANMLRESTCEVKDTMERTSSLSSCNQNGRSDSCNLSVSSKCIDETCHSGTDASAALNSGNHTAFPFVQESRTNSVSIAKADTLALDHKVTTTDESMSVPVQRDRGLEKPSHACQRECPEGSTHVSLTSHCNSTLGQTSGNVHSSEIPNNDCAANASFGEGPLNVDNSDVQMTSRLLSKDTCRSDDAVSTACTWSSKNLTEASLEKDNISRITAEFSHEDVEEKNAACDTVTLASKETPMEDHVVPKESSCSDMMDQTVPDEEEGPLHYNRDHTGEGVLSTEADTGTLYEPSMSHDGKQGSLFYWSHQPTSYTEQLVPTKTDLPLKDSSSNGVWGVSPLKTCSRPIRVGLSRRQRVQQLHPYNKPKE